MEAESTLSNNRPDQPGSDVPSLWCSNKTEQGKGMSDIIASPFLDIKETSRPIDKR